MAYEYRRVLRDVAVAVLGSAMTLVVCVLVGMAIVWGSPTVAVASALSATVFLLVGIAAAEDGCDRPWCRFVVRSVAQGLFSAGVGRWFHFVTQRVRDAKPEWLVYEIEPIDDLAELRFRLALVRRFHRSDPWYAFWRPWVPPERLEAALHVWRVCSILPSLRLWRGGTGCVNDTGFASYAWRLLRDHADIARVTYACLIWHDGTRYQRKVVCLARLKAGFLFAAGADGVSAYHEQVSGVIKEIVGCGSLVGVWLCGTPETLRVWRSYNVEDA